jgi:hypothetical protein
VSPNTCRLAIVPRHQVCLFSLVFSYGMLSPPYKVREYHEDSNRMKIIILPERHSAWKFSSANFSICVLTLLRIFARLGSAWRFPVWVQSYCPRLSPPVTVLTRNFSSQYRLMVLHSSKEIPWCYLRRYKLNKSVKIFNELNILLQYRLLQYDPASSPFMLILLTMYFSFGHRYLPSEDEKDIGKPVLPRDWTEE